MVISDLIDAIRLLFVSEKKPFLQLKSILGFYPHDIKIYNQALMHKSVAFYEHEKDKAQKKQKSAAQGEMDNEGKNATPKNKMRHINNERLEFLGDAILGAVVADILYRHFGTKQEGFLTTIRSRIVCRNSLNKLAVSLGLDKLVHYTGARTSGHNSFMTGNAFEAFIGAIYLDRGYEYCQRFIQDVVFDRYIQIDELTKDDPNYKSTLIEWCQKNQYLFEFVQTETRDSKNHNTPIFHSRIMIEGVPCGKGMGYTKKESDQNSAKQALKNLKQDKELLSGINKTKNKQNIGE